MSDGEKGEGESALKDNVTGVVEGATITIHRFQGCEFWQVYSSLQSQILLFMISVASA